MQAAGSHIGACSLQIEKHAVWASHSRRRALYRDSGCVDLAHTGARGCILARHVAYISSSFIRLSVVNPSRPQIAASSLEKIRKHIRDGVEATDDIVV